MKPLVVSRSQRRLPFAGAVAAAFLSASLVFAATPAAATGAHSARLSADLADHLSAGSQTIHPGPLSLYMDELRVAGPRKAANPVKRFDVAGKP